MDEWPSLDDDIENDLYDDLDLETNVFVKKETALHKKARRSNKKGPVWHQRELQIC